MTRLDLAFSVSKYSRYTTNPTSVYLLRLSVQHLGVTSIGPRLVLVERSVKDPRIVGFVQVLDIAG